MQNLTQTRSDNCWQTCVAMLLERSVEELPQQHESSSREAYCKALRVFLDKHHDRTYVEVKIGSPMFSVAKEQFKSSPHLIIGETIRTTTSNDSWHAVVGVGGKVHWDVHPSRKGLTSVKAWGLVVPIPEGWREQWKGQACTCAACSAKPGCAVGAQTIDSVQKL